MRVRVGPESAPRRRLWRARFTVPPEASPAREDEAGGPLRAVIRHNRLMGLERWTAVDSYVEDMLLGSDSVLDATLARARAAELPGAEVSPAQGKLLHLLARLQGARAILEIGTLAGYSTIWLARAVPRDGIVTSLEIEPGRGQIAAENVAAAGLADVVDIRIGPADQTLAQLVEQGRVFDLAFLDADKANNPRYLTWALQLLRPGGALIADNVVRGGALADHASADPNIAGLRRFHELLAADPRLDATTIQTVGRKGYDGFTLALLSLDDAPG